MSQSQPSTMPLFRWAETRPVVAPSASTQSQQLARVEGAQAVAILAWLRERVGGTFHMADLEAAIPGTPGSAGRVMRALRAQGQVEVTNIDRASSLYSVGAVHG